MITLHQLVAKVRELALAAPDATNPTNERNVCFNFYEDGKPGCIIGQAVYALGYRPPTDALSIPQMAAALGNRGVLDTQATNWACDVQSYMDGKLDIITTKREVPARPWRDVLRFCDQVTE